MQIMNLFDLNNRVVVITGATGVLGKSISEYFALQGASVVILVRESSIHKGDVLVADIKSKGGKAQPKVKPVQTAPQMGIQLSMFQLDDPVLVAIRDQIKGLDINSLTPLEALNKLNEIKRITGL